MYSVPLPRERLQEQLFRPKYDGNESVWRTLNPLPPTPLPSKIESELQRFHLNINETEDEIGTFKEERLRNLLDHRKTMFSTSPIDTSGPAYAEPKHIPMPVKLVADIKPLPVFVEPIKSEPIKIEDKNLDVLKVRQLPWPENKLYQGPMENLYFPFGSSGGGAPNRDVKGKIVTKVPGPNTLQLDEAESKRRHDVAFGYNQDLEYEIVEQHLNKLKINQEVRAPFGDLVDVLNDGKVGKPKRHPETGKMANQHLPQTDITRSLGHFASLSGMTPNEYAASLDSANAARERLRNLEKLREHREELSHLVTADRMWGKPGGGAPNPNGTLQRVRGGIEKEFYEPAKPVHHSKIPLVMKASPKDQAAGCPEFYAVRSWHHNRYDVPPLDSWQKREMHRHEVTAPWDSKNF